jgi:hypothetical protein
MDPQIHICARNVQQVIHVPRVPHVPRVGLGHHRPRPIKGSLLVGLFHGESY